MDRPPLVLLARRVRWRNVARAGTVAALGLLALLWPRLSSAPVAVPAAGAVPVVRGPVGRVVLAPGPGPEEEAAAPARSVPPHPARSAVVHVPRRPAHRRPHPKHLRPKHRPKHPHPKHLRPKHPHPRGHSPAAVPVPRTATTSPPPTTPTTTPVPTRRPAREFGPAGGDFGG